MSGVQPWLRRAGRLERGGGETILWSVAEGRRGRRWRSIRRDAGGHLVSDLLLELDPAGRWSRLELATADGLLTLHPEAGGGAAHGNVVTPDGMRHISVPWGAGHRLVVAGDPVAAGALSSAMPAGPGPGLVVTASLDVEWLAAVETPPASGNLLPGPSWPLELA